jgi:hypothetical protein
LFGELFGQVLIFTAGAPFWIPPKLAHDDYSAAGYFPDYPYQDGIAGYLMIDPWLPILHLSR